MNGLEHLTQTSLNVKMALRDLYHVDLEVDGQSHVIRHVVLPHVHDVVQLV